MSFSHSQNNLYSNITTCNRNLYLLNINVQFFYEKIKKLISSIDEAHFLNLHNYIAILGIVIKIFALNFMLVKLIDGIDVLTIKSYMIFNRLFAKLMVAGFSKGKFFFSNPRRMFR